MMQGVAVQTHSLSSGILYKQWYPRTRIPFSAYSAPRRTLFRAASYMRIDYRRKGITKIQDSSGQHSNSTAMVKRKVVEHLCLIKAKDGLSEEEEKDMLDYLYTSQYYMPGIVAISLGRTSDQSLEDYSHAMCMRFQRKEDLQRFYEHPSYKRILEEHVNPYCLDFLEVDFESEVQDDVLLIFRKGEEFNYGVEFIMLIAFTDSALGSPAEDALASLAELVTEFPTLIVQSSQGGNFNQTSKDYTHGVIIRFRSVDAMEIFLGSREYKDLWRSSFEPVSLRSLSIYYKVDPVGSQIM